MNYKERFLKDIEDKFKIQIYADIIQDYYWQVLEEKDKEIERLNNIINELEKWLVDNDKYYLQEDDDYWKVLDKLQELKGSDKE